MWTLLCNFGRITFIDHCRSTTIDIEKIKDDRFSCREILKLTRLLFRYNFRYGFVTYETQDSVDNALKDSDSLNLHGKKLNIGRAVRKQQPTSSQSAFADPMLNTWMYHPGGYASLTGQSGVTYFVAPTNQVHQFVSSRKWNLKKASKK